MSLSPEKMAEFFASELIDDVDKLADYLLEFGERWCQYGQQYEALLTSEKRAEVEECIQRFFSKLKHLGAE